MSYRYIGNKIKLLPWLMPVIRDIAGADATVADLMCGTATVSEALRLAGHRVIASDVMTFSVQHAFVRLTLDAPPHFTDLGLGSYYDVLTELNSLTPRQGYIWREYSPAGTPAAGVPARKYFTPDNASRIDAMRSCILEWESSGRISAVESRLLHHDLVLAVNRVANIAGTYGHFRSKWSNGSLRPIQLQASKFIPWFRTDHCVLQGYAEDLASTISADLCYLDPPYMKRQYAANYHLLETIARGDEPPAIGVSGLRPWRDQYSDFCSKVKIWDAFTHIIAPMQCPHFLISYSEDGLIPLADLEEFFTTFGEVRIMKRENQRFRSNDSPLGREVTEYLIHLEKRCM
jgi:adenine-specific DNA-methyltransferase